MVDFDEQKVLKQYKRLRYSLFNRLFLMMLLLILQLALFVIFILKLEPYFQIFFNSSLAISVIFLIFLVNSNAENEFKIAWFLPTLVFPIFGIFIYVFLKHNPGGFLIGRRLSKLKKQTSEYKYRNQLETSFEEIPQLRGLAEYLYNSDLYPMYGNNQTSYYPNGETAFPEMIRELQHAKEFILLEYFIIEPGQMFAQIFEILKQKASEGVVVRILYDGLGSLSITSKKNIEFLKLYNIQAQAFMPFAPIWDTGLNSRDHRKALIIDGKVCFIGGINISDEYINLDHHRFAYWKDSVMKIQGDGVKTYSLLFLEMYHLQLKTAIPQQEFNDFITNVEYPKIQSDGIIIPYADDAYNNTDIAKNVIKYIIWQSKKYVHIITPYLIIDTNLMEALIFAKSRGVDVSLIVPKNYDHLITYCVGRKNIKKLIENGIKIYQYTHGFIHSKIIVSDDVFGTVGSVNLDYRSLYHHFENSVLLYKTSSISDIERDFQITKAQSQEVTMEIYKKTPVIYRILGWFLRILSPLL